MNFVFAMKFSSDFVQGSNIYKLSTNFNQILWLLQGTIPPVIRKIFLIRKIIILESNRECATGIL